MVWFAVDDTMDKGRSTARTRNSCTSISLRAFLTLSKEFYYLYTSALNA